MTGLCSPRFVVAVGMGIMNGFHVSWGTGYESKVLIEVAGTLQY